MATKQESAIRTAIKNFIIGSGGFAIVVSGGIKQSSGIPDLDASIWSPHWGLLGGWMHWKIEVKTDDGKPSKKQIEMLRLYRQQGYCVAICTSVEDFQRVLNAYEAWDLIKRTEGHADEETVFSHYGVDDKWDIYPPYERLE